MEGGESEGRPVIGRIGVATSPRPATVQTSAGSLVTREFVEPLREEKQMNAAIAVCAASGWATGQKAINGYREGQAISMAKPVPERGL